jgi:hypothetical protein
LKGGAVKIVDRMEFSSNNFNPEIIKGWQRWLHTNYFQTS